MIEKEELPVIELIEDDFGNLRGIKKVYEQIPKILVTGDTEFFRGDIENFLKKNSSINVWKQRAPKELSKNMATYQEYNTDYDKDELNKEINEIGLIIPNGQYLFHGGLLNFDIGKKIVLDRPLATSLSPGEALFHAKIAGKAYGNEKIELLVLLVNDIKTSAMILFQDDALLLHELEVLFASGLILSVESKHTICKKFKVKNVDETDEKEVPVDIIMCEIS
ncbi:hypothetical protein [Arcobacter sp.]|uniref:hypothetical protein n=1 Tax=Arcobacter sp. TaxID=1872629 RepID=UPI003D0D8336